MPDSSGSSAVQEIRQKIDADVLESADEAGVDADEIIAQKAEERNDSYGAGTIARFAQTAIESQVEAEQAEVLKGIIMGSRDRYGKNWPRRHSLLRSSGDHLEVSTWDGNLPNADGTEVKIPRGNAIVSMACDFDAEYESYEGSRIEDVTRLSAAETVEEVSKVAVAPSDISRGDEYETVAVAGTVGFVNPQTVFEGGEPQGDGPVLMPDEREQNQPHFELVLEREDGTIVRAHFERQSYGMPTFNVEDLGVLLEDAVAEHGDDPEAQASFLQTALKGMDVIVVGNVNSFDTNRSGDEVTEYVDIGGTALIQTDADHPEEVTEDAPEADEADDGDDESDDEADASSDDGEEEAEQADDNGHSLQSVREDIETYADVAEEDIGDLTVEDVMVVLDDDVPEEMVQEALKGEAPDEAEEADDGALSSLKEDGMWHCPIDDCLAQEPSKAAIVGHGGSEHDLSPDEMAEKVGDA